ncbi:MAG: UDP-N-acetylglucosamine 2-epimerase (non-hydrolyzing) [Crocinitomicaceae bacterium]|nr:UDP-N-acetylglucosamine 2-epimerase (non-hydrolyzing) [Crocinitomicaceae bacterium]|tara:strand:- start:8312 stop:9439 length:1128 start_codon:yes stop_codon:yes gene_type:complete
MKVITILGTRPEIIRLSLTMKLLDKYLNHKIIHTGQNFDYELNDVFFNDLELRKPDYFLNINTNSLGSIYGEIIIKTEEILKKENPDAVLILGDTNSSISCIIAKRLQIPIYHVEAGNRSFDQNVPEEINRKIIDHIADFNIVYSERSRQHLISEGYPHRKIYLCGSPINEIFQNFKTKLKDSKILKKLNLDPENYFVASIHRQENVDLVDNLIKIVDILNSIAIKYDNKIIVSTHPRTLEKLGSIKNKNIDKRIDFLKPFGFYDYLTLQQKSKAVISDSGTISEESAILNFPAITLRKSMERPEAIDTGAIIITGLDKETVLKSIDIAMDHHKLDSAKSIPEEYRIKNTSWRILKLILGTAKLSNQWNSIIKLK